MIAAKAHKNYVKSYPFYVFRKFMLNDKKRVSNSESNTFALLGMTFLWALWPSFNARNLVGTQ